LLYIIAIRTDLNPKFNLQALQDCHNDIAEGSVLLGCEALWMGEWLPAFKISYCLHIQWLSSARRVLLELLYPSRKKHYHPSKHQDMISPASKVCQI
jgi:hypothetical protein